MRNNVYMKSSIRNVPNVPGMKDKRQNSSLPPRLTILIMKHPASTRYERVWPINASQNSSVKSKWLERLHHEQNRDRKWGSRAEQEAAGCIIRGIFIGAGWPCGRYLRVPFTAAKQERSSSSRRRSLLTSHDSRWLVRLRGERVVRPRLLRPLIYDPVGTRACKRIPRVKAGTLAAPTAILSPAQFVPHYSPQRQTISYSRRNRSTFHRCNSKLIKFINI